MQQQTGLGICAVRYLGDRIVTVQTLSESGDVKEPPKELSRRVLVEAIQTGIKFVTIHKNDDGTWDHWDTANLIPVEGSQYVKVHNDRSALDDLGDLPDY